MATSDGQSAETQGLWAKSVVEKSSEYDERWGAIQILGPATVYPANGDIKGTWAQKTLSADEFIVVEYEEQIFVTAIEIYETYNAGGVVGVSAFDNFSNTWIKLWEAKSAQRVDGSRIFSPPIGAPPFKIDRIRLNVDCTVAKTWVELDAVKIKGTRLSSNKPPVSEFSIVLKEFVNNSLFSDVKFTIEGKEVSGHKAILSARSGYFRALLCGGNFEPDKAIKLDDISYAGFVAMMEYIYTNDCDPSLPTEVLTELIRIGDKLSMNNMRAKSYSYLQQNMTVDNVIYIYCNATEKLPHLPDIEDLALDFMAKHLTKVTRTTLFINLSRETMLVIIQETTARLNLN